MSPWTLDPGPSGRGGGLVSRLVPQYLCENENKPPSRQTPHVNTRPEEQKSPGRKKSLPSFRCSSLRPPQPARQKLGCLSGPSVTSTRCFCAVLSRLTIRLLFYK